MSEEHAAFLQEVAQLAKALDGLDYYQVLAVDYQASSHDIRIAYHQKARRFHPDRYHHLNLPNLYAALTRIAKRITEAYVILRADQTRRMYTQGIEGPERAHKLRYLEKDEREHKDQEQAQKGKTPQVQQFDLAAKKAHGDGDVDGAIKSLKMALMFEADNEHFKALLAEWQPPEPTAEPAPEPLAEPTPPPEPEGT